MSDDIQLWRDYRQTRDPGLRDQLVEKHLVLVKYAAARVAGRCRDTSGSTISIRRAWWASLPRSRTSTPSATWSSARTRASESVARSSTSCVGSTVVPRRVRRLSREAAHADRRPDAAPGTAAARRRDRGGDEDRGRRLSTAAHGRRDAAVARRRAGRGAGAARRSTPSRIRPCPIPSRRSRPRSGARARGRFLQKLPERERQVLSLYYHEELTMHEVGRSSASPSRASRRSTRARSCDCRRPCDASRRRVGGIGKAPAARRRRVRWRPPRRDALLATALALAGCAQPSAPPAPGQRRADPVPGRVLSWRDRRRREPRHRRSRAELMARGCVRRARYGKRTSSCARRRPRPRRRGPCRSCNVSRPAAGQPWTIVSSS